MNTPFIVIGFSIAFFLFGFYLGQHICRLISQGMIHQLNQSLTHEKEQLEQHLNDNKRLQEINETLHSEKESVNIAYGKAQSEIEALKNEVAKEKIRFQTFEKDFNDKFENLAHKIMLEKTEKFTLKNQENIENILKPLSLKIKEFEEQVGKTNADFTRGHAALEKQLEILNEQNIRISEEANNLTRALKGDTKTQGNWGELILERVLERSNLVKNREYFVQQTFMDKDGNKQIPDVVIHLPNEKRMIIDSKVSLNAYERYVNEEDPKLKQQHIKEHIRSLNTHIAQLSSKKYEELLKGESPDFVLLFIPIEAALYTAQNEDNTFFYTAFQRNILLVSPTTLLSTLRTIDALWSNEKQHQNAQEIAKHAASLYHKFRNLIEELETVGKRLESTQNAYSGAMLKLTGNQNLVKDIVKLETLGISPKEPIKPHWIKKGDDETPLIS